jgi:hypothetical protein
MSTIIRMLMFGVGAAGVVGGPYILYLAYYKPSIFPRPNLAKRQGAIAFTIGVALLAVIFIFKI